MAGDWIKVEHVTPDKPEIYQLASVCGITPEDAFGRCLRIWIWADQQSLNGHALTVTFVTLDAISRRDGFATALCKVKWLIDNGDGTVTFPNFDRHNGKTAKTRATSSDRKKNQRERDKENVTEESRFERDISVTREEKRREEGKTNSADKKPSSISLQSFLDSLNGARAIDSDDPIFAYCEKCGISEEMLNLCWLKFKDYYLENPSKKYKDWRKTFRNCVKDNWYGIWWFNADNKAELSNKGRQAAVSFKEAA